MHMYDCKLGLQSFNQLILLNLNQCKYVCLAAKVSRLIGQQIFLLKNVLIHQDSGRQGLQKRHSPLSPTQAGRNATLKMALVG